MGSGGGGQSTTNTGQYPAQFQPLAEAAVKQILGLQNQLPLAQFARPNAAQTAGLSPFQQATMNFLPNLLAPSWGLQALQNTGQPIGQLATNAIGVGNQTDPYSNALAALASGGFGRGSQAFPNMAPPSPFQLQAPQMTQAAPQPTVAGPGTEGLIPQMLAQLQQPVPTSPPILPAIGVPTISPSPTPVPPAPSRQPTNTWLTRAQWPVSQNVRVPLQTGGR